MKALEQEPEILAVARRWLRRDSVTPEQLRASASKIIDVIHEHSDTLPEGQILFLSHLAGAMNQDATILENNRIRQAEGLL